MRDSDSGTGRVGSGGANCSRASSEGWGAAPGEGVFFWGEADFVAML